MPRRLVLRHQAMSHGPVNRRHGCLESGFCYSLVTRGNGLDHALDVGANVRPLTGVALTVFFGLTSAFAS